MNALLMLLMLTPPAAPQVRLITVDPGHFHAALVQKEREKLEGYKETAGKIKAQLK